MKQFEYKHLCTVDMNEAVSELERLGTAGWECFSVIPGVHETIYMLKRELC